MGLFYYCITRQYVQAYYLFYAYRNVFLNTVLWLHKKIKRDIIVLSWIKTMLTLEKDKKQMRGLTNYVLIGIFGFDLVAFLFGPATLASNIVYAIIGIAALIWLIWIFVDRPISNNR